MVSVGSLEPRVSGGSAAEALDGSEAVEAAVPLSPETAVVDVVASASASASGVTSLPESPPQLAAGISNAPPITTEMARRAERNMAGAPTRRRLVAR